MSDRATLNMRNITLAIKEVMEWYSLGLALKIPDYKLKEIKINQQFSGPKQCKFSMIDVWLRTDVAASWGKLAAALDEAGEDVASGRIKQQYLNLPPSATVPPSALAPANGERHDVAFGGTLQPLLLQAQPHMMNYSSSGQISTDGPISHSPVPISAQAPPPPPVTNVTDIVNLLKTSQERLISGLTHSTLDVNLADGNAQRMTLLHYAAMQGANTDCLKGLIAFGANINPLNSFNMTPLDLAKLSPTGGEMAGVLEGVGAKTAASLTRGQQPVGHPNHRHNPRACNILSLTSSGPYCIVQLEALQQIEVRTSSRITELFQWIVACGFGALFLLLIIYGNKSVSDVKRLYFKLREEVFCQADMARRSQALDGFLQAHLGTQMKMNDILQPRVLIGALFKGSSKVETRLFNNCFQDNLSDVSVWKVARYTCSLPLNVMESDSYISTDPALPNLSSHALRRIRQHHRDCRGDMGMVRSLVCIEAGGSDAQELGCVDVPVAALTNSSSSSSSQWFTSHGALHRLTQLLTLYHSSAVSSSEETLSCCRELCELYDIELHHFNPILTRRATLDMGVALKDVVESVIETITQFVGKPLHDITTCLNNV